ncbi:MAG: hypothetical protein ACFB6R_11815 [Alphaproteobacteria bacterium]
MSDLKHGPTRWIRSLIALALILPVPAFAFEEPQPFPYGGQSESRWSGSVRTFFGQNNNVPIVPDQSFFQAVTEGTDDSAPFTGLQGAAQYLVLNRGGTRVGVAFAASYLYYFDSEEDANGNTLKRYNQLTSSAKAFASQAVPIFGRPGTITASYTFRNESGPIEAIGAGTHTGQVGASVKMASDLVVNAGVAITGSRFDVVFPDPDLDDRSGKTVAFSVSGEKTLARDSRVIAGYDLTLNDANGSNFDYLGHRVKLRGEAPLTPVLWVSAEGAVNYRDYDGFQSDFVPPPGRQRQINYDLAASALWVISRTMQADFFINQQFFTSNSAQFQADRRQIGVGVTRKFGG